MLIVVENWLIFKGF